MYCFGPKGIKTLMDIVQQKKDIVVCIDQLKQDNKQLEQQIEYYSTDFAQEKIAREVLLMKRENETVYFVS